MSNDEHSEVSLNQTHHFTPMIKHLYNNLLNLYFYSSYIFVFS